MYPHGDYCLITSLRLGTSYGYNFSLFKPIFSKRYEYIMLKEMLSSISIMEKS